MLRCLHSQSRKSWLLLSTYALVSTLFWGFPCGVILSMAPRGQQIILVAEGGDTEVEKMAFLEPKYLF